MYYAYSSDSQFTTWTVGNGGSPVMADGELPYVVKEGSYYYMMKSQPGVGMAIYYSSDKINWTLGNGGSPVVTPSAVGTDWWKSIFNPAFAVVGGVWHLVLEGKADSGAYAQFQLGYSYTERGSEGVSLCCGLRHGDGDSLRQAVTLGRRRRRGRVSRRQVGP